MVTFVGRLDPKKHVEDLLAAALSLLPRYPSLHVLVVGGADALQPEYADETAAGLRHAACGPRVVFTGTRRDVPEILTASDILVAARRSAKACRM